MNKEASKPTFTREASDRFGLALLDYFHGRFTPPLKLHNTYGPAEELPLDGYLYHPEELPEFDVFALSCCRGRVLDIGAAAGRHALALAGAGMEVLAIDKSGHCCEVMVERGVKEVIQEDIFKFEGGGFDTALMLMNGIGLVGDLSGYLLLLERIRGMINPGGRIIFDSSDIGYLFHEQSIEQSSYYGIIKYAYQYKSIRGPWFRWLYIDPITACRLAEQAGWHAEIIYEDETDTYLAMLRLDA
jgi:SAM-dependent methyltransferase